jgi:nitrate reductase cytochrome c-type subunit
MRRRSSKTGGEFLWAIVRSPEASHRFFQQPPFVDHADEELSDLGTPANSCRTKHSSSACAEMPQKRQAREHLMATVAIGLLLF